MSYNINVIYDIERIYLKELEKKRDRYKKLLEVNETFGPINVRNEIAEIEEELAMQTKIFDYLSECKFENNKVLTAKHYASNQKEVLI